MGVAAVDERSIFLTGLSILIIFNVAYFLSRPAAEQTVLITQMGRDGVIGLIVTVGAVAVLSGTNVLGSGLNTESVKLLFGIATLLNVLFSINFGPIGIGIGLVNPLFTVFILGAGGFLMLLGFLVATGIALMVLVSGIVIIQG